MTAHPVIPDPRAVPLPRAPRSARAPYFERDDAYDHLAQTDSQTWRRLVRLDRYAALVEPIEDLDLTSYELYILEDLAAVHDVPTIGVLVSLLWRARQAGRQP